MDFLPQDPAILVSSVNMLLRDEEFDSLAALCYAFGEEPAALEGRLLGQGYEYSLEQKQFRPTGFDGCGPVPKDAVETAYSFFHQKYRVYEPSTLDWQRDDIEWAVADYVSGMDPHLYRLLAAGRTDFLKDHTRFDADMVRSLAFLEAARS